MPAFAAEIVEREPIEIEDSPHVRTPLLLGPVSLIFGRS